MGAYEPKFLYVDQVTATASAAVTGGRLLAVSGNGTVQTAGAGSAAVVGVAAHDAASGSRVSYFPRGKIHVSPASGAITAAARVDSGAGGTVASGTAGVNNIGIALTTAADGVDVEWMEI
ncbi:capsid cement protein [Micromonospora sp. WMMD737]|uniref:capsid cement protein n=1 Tax=Micromonospora sp. WMMD737 TaxID=3404113 RepID=UPI003B959E73